MEKAKTKSAEGASGAVKYKTMIIQDSEYKTLLTRKYENKKPFALRNPKEIKSFLPGTILEIKVKAGAKVKLGDPLLVFEAMKMQNILKSTMDGTIKAIHVKVSDTIPNGTLLVEYE
jgi:biotin carboxyl carrier protein